MSLSSALRLLGGALAPPSCAICAAPCHSSELICHGCEAALELAPPGTAGVLGVGAVSWAAPYEGVARELVAALKFGGRLGLARIAAGAIVAAIGDRCRETGAVVAVPPAPVRRLRRGFDPAELIARSVAAELGVAFTPALRRTQGPRQVGRRRVERLTSAPRVRAGGPAPSRALLIDDVLTTGATLSACAAALRRSGCVDVSAAVFARTLAPGGHRPKIGGASASR